MSAIIQFMIENKAVLLACGLALSELLSLNSKIKANGIFKLIVNAMKKMVEPKAELAPAEAPKA